MAEFDDRSEKNLATLRPKAQPFFRALLRSLKAYAADHSLDVRIISGNRTWAEQDALYAQGRTKPGPIVTNARGGQSNHNYQIAVDIGLFDGSDYLEESPYYSKMGPLGEAVGLEWGGRWVSIQDTPHYQIKTGRTVAQLRELVRTDGWDAIDALIPDAPGDPPAPPDPTIDTVTVLVDRGVGAAPHALDLDAWFLDSRVWVAIRDWSDYFGGTVTEDDGVYQLTLNGQSTPVPTQLIGERTAARFADINTVLGWDYSFDGASRPRRLIIHHDPGQ